MQMKNKQAILNSSCKCYRCKGLLVNDVVLSELHYWIKCIRCVNCGCIKLEEVIPYAIKTENRRTNRMGELELYRARSRRTECDSNSVQYQ